MESPLRGLTSQEVNERIARGEVNTAPRALTRSIPRIFRDNLVTFFNILIAILFVLMMISGEYKNGFFFLVVLANIAIGSAQEIRSKITIDRLSVITQTHVNVIRDGQEQAVRQEDIVLGDTLLFSLGNQVCADGKVLVSNMLEIDESLLTGESHAIKKQPGDTVLSGSFVVAGKGAVEVSAVGTNSYANQLSAQAKYEKKSNSQLMRTINFIIKTLTFALVPLGVILFLRTYLGAHDLNSSLLAATAASVGMIPAGLVLLSSVAFAVGAFNLVRHRTLTQSMPSIETLARVDVLCVDKTGTITDGTLSVSETVPLGAGAGNGAGSSSSLEAIERVMGEFVRALPIDNKTSEALAERFAPTHDWVVEQTLAFSSARKLSACTFKEQGSFVLGAPEFVLPHMNASLRASISGYAARGLRVILLAHSNVALPEDGLSDELTSALSPLALIVIADHVRDSAPATFTFFKEQDVEIKVISGDNPETVSTIAGMASIDRAERYIDMSTVAPDAPLKDIVTSYTVFGRTSPEQKRDMIKALRAAGKLVGMTGDGVNDAMALREADVGIAMASGSEATRTAADFVLIDSDFSSMVHVVREGRRVVNNIEGVASLYITKTIYSVVITLLFIFLSFKYPFQPIQLTLLGFFMIGVPSLFLTFEPNYQPMHDRFVHQLVKDAIPAATLVTLNVIAIQIIALFVSLSSLEVSTLSLLLNGVICACLLVRVFRPFNKLKVAMVILLISGFSCGFIFFGGFFELTSIFSSLAFIWVPLVALVYPLYQLLTKAVLRIEAWWLNRHVNTAK